MARLYAELRGLMAVNDYTQPQLARKLGIGVASLSRRFNAAYPFSVDEAYTTLDLFNIPHSRLHEVFPPEGRKETPT